MNRCQITRIIANLVSIKLSHIFDGDEWMRVLASIWIIGTDNKLDKYEMVFCKMTNISYI